MASLRVNERRIGSGGPWGGLAGYGIFCLKSDRPDTLAIFQNVNLFFLAKLAVNPQAAGNFL